MMSTNEDITERKQAEDILKRDNETFYRLVREKTEALVETKLELEKSKRLSDIGSLAAIVDNELRTPMAAIGVVVYNMKRKTTDQYMTASLENIQKNPMFQQSFSMSRWLFPALHRGRASAWKGKGFIWRDPTGMAGSRSGRTRIQC